MLLSACGGGGGGGGGTAGAPPVQTATPSAITAANATRAASNAYGAIMVLNTTTASLPSLLTSIPVPIDDVSVLSPVYALSRYVRNLLLVNRFVTQARQCSQGGSVNIEVSLRDANMISNGDTLSMTAKDCILDEGTVNGTMKVTYSNLSSDFSSSLTSTATLEVQFSNFNITRGSDMASLDGDLKMALNQNNTGSSLRTISGKSLQTTERHAGASINRTLTDYTVSTTATRTATASTPSFTLSGNTAALGPFSYTVKNVQPFDSVSIIRPSNGALVVSEGGASATATVVGNGVRVDFSGKGDGSVTQTTTLNWPDFLATI
jgi:hypothetical protein